MKNIIEDISFKTNGKNMYEITDEVKAWIANQNLHNGQFNLFIQHTSASLTIMENASPEILDDINNFFLKLVPEDSSLYLHNLEGNDDLPAHIKYMLTQTSLTIPIKKKRLVLGTWQGIFLFEHRYHSTNRQITFSFIGD